MARVKPVPDGYHTVTPYLIVDDGPRALEFYRSVDASAYVAEIESILAGVQSESA